MSAGKSIWWEFCRVKRFLTGQRETLSSKILQSSRLIFVQADLFLPTFLTVHSLFCWFRRLEISYSPEGESLAWRRAEGGVVVGSIWFWSDMPTWSMASQRKAPIFKRSSEYFLLMLPQNWIWPAWLCFAGLLWQSWTFWTHCRRLKWVWPIRLMENLCLVSQVGHPHPSTL